MRDNMEEPKKVILTASKDDPEFTAFYQVAAKTNKLLHDTLLEIMPRGGGDRRSVYVHWWTLYLGTLLDELAEASLQLLLLDKQRAAVVTIRQVFEYSIRTQYLHAHDAEAESLMDSLQWRVWKEAEFTPDYFDAGLREQYAENYRQWAEEHRELDLDSKEGSFTSWAREVLGKRFNSEFFRQYSYPSIIAHGKPHGVMDVLEPLGPGQVRHFWDSRTIDSLSEVSKLTSTIIEYVVFVRRKYELELSRAVELNAEHGEVQRRFGYVPTTPPPSC